MKSRMVWASENESGTLTIHRNKADAQATVAWGNGLRLRRVRYYA